jgi:predicted RNase H-like HicB family nuclease
MKYRVLLQRDDDGYAASVPGLPGCWSQGATEAEALANVTDAIREYLATVDALTSGGDVRVIDIPG